MVQRRFIQRLQKKYVNCLKNVKFKKCRIDKKKSLEHPKTFWNSAIFAFRFQPFEVSAFTLRFFLSGGQKQRVSFGTALIGNPPLLVLDEPTVGTDPLLRLILLFYAFQNLTILMCHRCFILSILYSKVLKSGVTIHRLTFYCIPKI